MLRASDESVEIEWSQFFLRLAFFGGVIRLSDGVSRGNMRPLLANVYTLCKVPYFPLLDSIRVYKQFGVFRAAYWFLLRLLVPFGVSQRKPGAEVGVVGQLRTSGFAELPPRSASEVTELINHFLDRKRTIDVQPYSDIRAYFAYWRSRATLRPTGLQANGRADCPLTRVSRDPLIANFVSEALDLPIERIRVQATIDALIRVEGKSVLIGGYDGAVEFHRDIDSWKWVKVFVYLTNTAEGDGHHEMFPTSHLRTPLSLIPIRRYKQAEILDAMPDLRLHKICGPAGFTFIENTFVFHRGTEPLRNDRLILIMSYYDESVSPWMMANETYPLAALAAR
jgi:hypothetical protein